LHASSGIKRCLPSRLGVRKSTPAMLGGGAKLDSRRPGRGKSHRGRRRIYTVGKFRRSRSSCGGGNCACDQGTARPYPGDAVPLEARARPRIAPGPIPLWRMPWTRPGGRLMARPPHPREKSSRTRPRGSDMRATLRTLGAGIHGGAGPTEFLSAPSRGRPR